MSSHRKQAAVDPDRALISLLQKDLQKAQFSVAAIKSFLGPVAASALQRTQLTPARVAVQNNPEPLATLTGLFLLGLPVNNEELATALPHLGVEGAQKLGLVGCQGTQRDDQVRARVDLRPYTARDAKGDVSWWIAADLGEEVLEESLPADHVLGVGGAAKTLAGLTVRTSQQRALDLGTGSGIQTLHLTRHCQRVVATDISNRALQFSRFNLALNDVASKQVELRAGSLFAPVADDTFDLVVSNPPFVITPPNSGLRQYEYRDTKLRGDRLVEKLLVQVGGHLKAGGIAQFLGNWEHRAGQSWSQRLEGWLETAEKQGIALDAWIVEREVQDPAQYAETWLRDGGIDYRRSPQLYERAYRAWLADFRARDVTGIGFGHVLLRRAPAKTTPRLRRLEHVDSAAHRPLGGHIAAVLAQITAAAKMSDEQILNAHFLCATDVTEERYGPPGASDPTMIFLRQGDGYGRSLQVSTWQSAFVGACDGELAAGQICGALAHLAQAKVSEVIAEILPFLRECLAQGFLQFHEIEAK